MLSLKYSSDFTKFLSNLFNFEQLFGIFRNNFWAFSEQNLERLGLLRSVRIKQVKFWANVRAFIPQGERKRSLIAGCPY